MTALPATMAVENPTSYTKIMRSGRIYILRGEKAYPLLGGEVATY